MWRRGCGARAVAGVHLESFLSRARALRCRRVSLGSRFGTHNTQHTRLTTHPKALKLAPSSSIYEARSHAHAQLGSYVEAAQDGGKAVELNAANAKAYLRKGSV